ncbi:hypothetical protein [Sulfobacillus thermosulfidooxidans]|uniref:hypothetical protein n=1 Tax=Sulfobacillus thermosulfidooxidans TaxID=28034 RepID=UPI0006B69C48|nr:hypothetical protein [Sulfobacillus thermosulfidooxidans]
MCLKKQYRTGGKQKNGEKERNYTKIFHHLERRFVIIAVIMVVFNIIQAWLPVWLTVFFPLLALTALVGWNFVPWTQVKGQWVQGKAQWDKNMEQVNSVK